jgi:uncharacterized protein
VRAAFRAVYPCQLNATRRPLVKLSERYRTVGDLPADIPIFPLRGVLLLPRAALPLNIFEPRYLKMFDDVIAGSRLVGIIQTERSAGDAESPDGKVSQLCKVGCVGRLTAFQEVDDGRMIISLSGIARFDVMQEISTAEPYRACRVAYDRFARDLVAGAGEEDVDREGLLKTLKAFLEARELKADWAAISRSPNEMLVNALAVMSPYGPEEKQALLECVDLKSRAEVLVALAEMELAAGPRGGSGGSSGSTLQ